MTRVATYRLVLPLCLIIAGSATALDLEVRASGRGDAAVSDLEAASFSLKAGGKDHVIESFRYVDDVTQTKIYIAVEVIARDFPRVRDAITKFIDERLPDGVEVSLGGSPFTSDSAQLKTWLETGTSLAKETPSAGVERLWQVDSALQIQGQPVLMRYHRLAAQLSATPGSKAVVLFRNHLSLNRSGLNTAPTATRSTQWRQDDADVLRGQRVLDRFGAQALFSGVSFYPADVDEGSATSEQGLNGVASVTDGRSLLGISEVGRIFDLVLEDAASYYVLGYSPELEGKGRLVSLKLDVDRKGVDLRFTKSYLDIPGLITGPTEGPAGMSSALDLEPAGSTLDVGSAYAFFRGEDGNPVAIVTAGLPASAATAAAEKKGVAVDLTLAAGALEPSGSLTASAERRLRQVFAKKGFEQAQKQASAVIDVSSHFALSGAGSKNFRAIIRDENGEAYGVQDQSIAVPDFSLPLETSTFLLTRRATEINAKATAEPWGDLLDYGSTRLIPESTRTFIIGETILFTYRLYNPPKALLAELPPVQIAVLKDEVQLEQAQTQGENRVVEGKSEIQYLGALRTDNLDPGQYLILSAVPGRDDARQPYVETGFTLVKK